MMGFRSTQVLNKPPGATQSYNDQMYQQIGDGTFNTGGTLNFSRYLSADNIAVSMNTITYSMDVTGNLSIGTNSSNTFTVNGTFDLGAF